MYFRTTEYESMSVNLDRVGLAPMLASSSKHINPSSHAPPFFLFLGLANVDMQAQYYPVKSLSEHLETLPDSEGRITKRARLLGRQTLGYGSRACFELLSR